MLQLNQQNKKKYFININKNINDLESIDNNIIKRNNLVINLNNLEMNNNKEEKKNKINNKTITFNFNNTLNRFYKNKKNKTINHFNKLIKHSKKINPTINLSHSGNGKKNINLLDFCTFSNLDLENKNKANNIYLLKENIDSISYLKKDVKYNIEKNKKTEDTKIKIKLNLNPSEIYYSPEYFENYISNSPQNKKTENFKHKIFLSEKKPKNKILKSFSNFNIYDSNKKNKIINQKKIKLITPSKILKKQKFPSLTNKKDKKYQNKETSISTICPANTDMKNGNYIKDNKLFEILFNDKKKMFRSQEIIILNNLNLIYSENDKQFDRFYLKHANKKSLFGMGLTHISSSPNLIKQNLVSKISFVKDKLSLIKSIVDFTYPEIILRRSMNQSNYYIRKFKKNIIPSTLEILKNKKKEHNLNKYYSSLLKINN